MVWPSATKRKTAVGFMMAACVCHLAVVASPLADPGRLLRVPRIYNALIRSDAKLQPSRASPHSSPVYQPLGLHAPEPGFDQWQPPSYALGPAEHTDELRTSSNAPAQNNDNDKPKLKSENTKIAAPLTFYPRSFGYYQPQPILPYGYPFGPQPYLFGSPYEFGQQPFFRYPTPSFHGYYGGLYSPAGVEQFSSGAYHPGNTETVETTKKTDEAAEKEIDVKSSSDSVGVRESEFLVDDEDDVEDVSEVADLKKGSHADEATS